MMNATTAANACTNMRPRGSGFFIRCIANSTNPIGCPSTSDQAGPARRTCDRRSTTQLDATHAPLSTARGIDAAVSRAPARLPLGSRQAPSGTPPDAAGDVGAEVRRSAGRVAACAFDAARLIRHPNESAQCGD